MTDMPKTNAPRRVLIGEEEGVIALQVESILCEHNCVWTSRISELLFKAAAGDFDVIVTNLMMRDEGAAARGEQTLAFGIEHQVSVLKALDRAGNNIPIVVLTTRRPGHPDHLFAEGHPLVCGFLYKPEDLASATSRSHRTDAEVESFNVYTTDLGEEASILGKLYDYDIILLDLNLPDMSGYEVLKQLRVAKVKTPILILSGLAGIEDKVKGLGSAPTTT
jgi:CheY-like chemotaxis protein